MLAPMARSAPNAKYENLWVFIRSDAHVVRAGLNIRGCGPLSTLGFFDRLGLSQSGSDFLFAPDIVSLYLIIILDWQNDVFRVK